MTIATVEIRMLPPQSNGYPIELTVNNQQQFRGGYVTLSDLHLTGSPDHDGEQIFAWLLSHTATQIAWAEIRGQFPKRRIRLRLDVDTPELHAIPWELMREPETVDRLPHVVAANATTPFSRYVAGQWPVTKPLTDRPLKMLVVIANPDGLERYKLAPIDVVTEQEILTTSIKEVAPQLDFTFLHAHGPITVPALDSALQQGYHLLHIVAHGLYNKRQQKGALLLADEANQVSLVFAERLAQSIADLPNNRPALVYLAVCQSATRSPADAFRGIAPRLIQAGVPTVLAMQDNVSIQTAHEFGRAFYRSLFDEGQVDVAANRARAVVIQANLSGSAIPVLFSRLPDNQLIVPPPADTLPVIKTLPYEPETVYIPAGTFTMGDDEDNGPPHSVTLPAYRIGVYPVTNQQYAEFVRQANHDVPKEAGWTIDNDPPADKLDHPIVSVGWESARAYCRWLTEQTGRTYRLPTEAEWERAGRGDDGRLYPWGNAWLDGYCNVYKKQSASRQSPLLKHSRRSANRKKTSHNLIQTTPVTQYPQGQSQFGCWDMIGNMKEWTSTLDKVGPIAKTISYTYPYISTDGREDGTRTDIQTVILRGGVSYRTSPTELLLTKRWVEAPTSRMIDCGFRVVMELTSS